MNRMYFFNRLKLNNNLIFNNYIGSENSWQNASFVKNFYGSLFLKRNISAFQFNRKSVFINLFRITRTKLFMNMKKTINDNTR